jgi:hypothetical protein
MLFETKEEQDEIIKHPYFILGVKIVKEILLVIRRYLFILPILVLLAFVYIYQSAKELRPTYFCDLTFIITQQEKSAGRNYALEELGLGRSSRPSVNFDKLKMYGFSKKIIGKALFTDISFAGKTDYAANHLMRLYNYNLPQPYYVNVDPNLIDSLPLDRQSVLNSLIGIVRSRLVTLSFGSGDIYKISVRSTSEEFALKFTNAYYDALKDFYIETALGSSYSSYMYFKGRLDSLSASLQSLEYAIANFQDRSHNIVREVAMVPLSDLERKRSALNKTYGEALSQFEISKQNYENAAPVFIVLDSPSAPLGSDSPTARSRYIMAAVASVFLYFVIVFFIMVWRYFGFIFIALFRT